MIKDAISGSFDGKICAVHAIKFLTWQILVGIFWQETDMLCASNLYI